MALQLITPPSVEPITFADALAHVKFDSAESQNYVNSLITAVREMAEQETGRALLPQTWKKTLDEFPDAIRLDHPPIRAVSSVKYYDLNGVFQTLDPASYYLDSASEPGWVVPAVNFAWPGTRAQANAVEVTYTAGYNDAASVPEPIKAWMKVMLRHVYDNPGAMASGGIKLEYVDRLLDRYSVVRA